MQLSEILHALESNYGIANWTPNEDGAISLVSDDVELSLIPIEEDNTILLYALVAPMLEEGAEELASVLLQVNHRIGAEETAVFGLHPEEKSYVLQRLLSCDTLDAERFALELLELIALAKKWKPLIQEYQPKKTGEADEASPESDQPIVPDIPIGWLSV